MQMSKGLFLLKKVLKYFVGSKKSSTFANFLYDGYYAVFVSHGYFAYEKPNRMKVF